MRVLVAGGSGFLGSHLAEALVARGDSVVVVDDLSTGREENLASIRGRVDFRLGDISEFEPDGRLDLVFNLASNASRAWWERHPTRVARANALGSDHLIRAALSHGATYVFASSSEVYGNPEEVPTREAYHGRVSPVGFRSAYDEGKRFGEALTVAYCRELGLRGIIVRLFNVYGPRMSQGAEGRVIERFVQQATTGQPMTIYGDGSQTRSFCYVDDAVDGLLVVADKGSSSQVYNLGSSEEVRILDLAKQICLLLGTEPNFQFEPLPPDDPRRRAADTTRIRALGWTPRVGLGDGLRAVIGSLKSPGPNLRRGTIR